MSSEQAETESKAAEIHRLEEHMRLMEAEVLRVVQVLVDELMTEHVLLAAVNRQAQVEHDPLARCTPELEAAAATLWRELSVVVRALQSLRKCIPASETRASLAGVWACWTIDKMFELCALVHALIQEVGGEHARVAGLDQGELSKALWVITAALTSKDEVSHEICRLQDGFPVKPSRALPAPSVGSLFCQLGMFPNCICRVNRYCRFTFLIFF